MKTSDFSYHLDEELIAQFPIEPRDSSRLMVYKREDDSVKHLIFRDILTELKSGDVMVINNTKVIPARLFGVKRETGAKIEILLLKRVNYDTWKVILKPAKRVSKGTMIDFSDELSCEIGEPTEGGGREVRFIFTGIFEDIISRVGTMPLPHYIHEELRDQTRYQTVYSKVDGSAAAPTAGLHFTDDLLKKIRDMGVTIVEVLLHVGLGTFRPVKADNILEHEMHSEYYEITPESCAVINAAKAEGRRVIAVGTTSVRVLESAASGNRVEARRGDTNIFIYPGYEFKVVDALITNFHLPESTLIMLVSALIGRERTLELYNLATSMKYRFFSFGDAMFIE